MTHEIITLSDTLSNLDLFHRIESWLDRTGQHWVKFHNGVATITHAVTAGEVGEVEGGLKANGWRVTPSLSMRGNFRAAPKMTEIDCVIQQGLWEDAHPRDDYGLQAVA